MVDPEWYKGRYPDCVAAKLEPIQHFTRFGAAENRDPNPFFDSYWYLGHYPDVAVSGLSPLVHYLATGAAELRNPNPRFDAPGYVEQHPAASANPLLYHLEVGRARGYPTERPVDIRDYLPSKASLPAMPRGLLVNVVVLISHGLITAKRCLTAVLAERCAPLARVVVVEGDLAVPDTSTWLRGLAAQGKIHLFRTRGRNGFAACVNSMARAPEIPRRGRAEWRCAGTAGVVVPVGRTGLGGAAHRDRLTVFERLGDRGRRALRSVVSGAR